MFKKGRVVFRCLGAVHVSFFVDQIPIFRAIRHMRLYTHECVEKFPHLALYLFYLVVLSSRYLF